MPHTLPRLSFEHVALALAKRGASPCVQWMRIPPGARSFLAARLFERLGRTLLYLCAGEKEAEEASRELTAYLGPDAVLPFPSIETTPYEPVPPHLPSVHDRMRALHRLLSGPPAVVVAQISAAAEKTLPPEAFVAAVAAVSPGDTLDVDAFAARLVTLGYARLPAAADPGDFAVRGGIVDVYSPAHPLPARLLLDGDVVESVRWFHPATQRTVAAGARADGEPGSGERLVILPCSQVITRDDFLAAACDGGDRPWSDLLRQGIRFHGADALLPRLYGHASPVFSYLPTDALVVAVDSVECVAAARNTFVEAEENYALAGEEGGYPAPSELVVPEAELVAARIAACFSIFITSEASMDLGTGYDRNVQGQYLESLEPGMIRHLLPGESITSFNPQRPAATFEPFVERILRAISAALGLPYELVAKDFSKTNYSSARAALLEARRYFRIRPRTARISGWSSFR